MIKNFDVAINNIDGKPLSEKDISVTMKKIVVDALMIGVQQETPEQSTGEQKAKRYKLGMSINAGGDVELKPEDIVMIKELVGKGYTPLVVGQIFEMLDK